MSKVPGYAGRRISQQAIDRMSPKMRAETQGVIKYTPAYEALLPDGLGRAGVCQLQPASPLVPAAGLLPAMMSG